MLKVPCINCGKPTDHKAAICTVKCWHDLARVPLLTGLAADTRLFGRVIRQLDGCWIWQGAVLKSGYGSFNMHGLSMTAHRAAYILRKGPIPAGQQVRRTCDPLLCINPDHLFVVTPKTKQPVDLEATGDPATASV